ncbi:MULTISPECIES: hypothetical protein [unclassified Caballeronia]|uniref:hypothetical protein n=1 Tax=unclassified Caballeronia TaxID=2646786 RepID=UPI002028ACCE|nr:MULTISPECIES: hypothetical protein [unclassified Caballeronia]
MPEFQRREARTKHRNSPVERYLIYLDAARKTGIFMLAILIVAAIAVNWNHIAPYLKFWLNDITHLKILGVEIDREKAENEVDRLIKKFEGNKSDDEMQIDATAARGALARALNSARAIAGTRLLWVDQNPDNNARELSFLRSIGIETFHVGSTSEALKFIPVIRPDVIISNISRPKDAPERLGNCPAHYYALPSWANGYSSLDQLNLDVNSGKTEAKGFALAEEVSKLPIPYNELADKENSRIIFYTARSGGISSSQCGRIVTNRTDVLLNEVVSVLEESNWRMLGTAHDSGHRSVYGQSRRFERRTLSFAESH